jgi:signal transduction histidine kinase
VDHISHELKTPLAVIQGIINILRRKFEDALAQPFKDAFKNTVDTLERNTGRLVEISQETDQIFRVTQEVEAGIVLNDIDRLLESMEDLSELPEAIRLHWEALKEWTGRYVGGNPWLSQSIDLYPFIVSILGKIKRTVEHRNLQFKIQGRVGFLVFMDPYILREVAESLIKNAIENTPDGGIIEVIADQRDTGVFLQICDRGIGITEENQGSLMDGLFHTVETDLYSTKKPFEFGAGGKGLELLRIKHYAERYGFDISLRSQRCVHIPTDSDVCPGDTTRCGHCKVADDCVASGGTTFTVTFPVRKNTNIVDE